MDNWIKYVVRFPDGSMPGQFFYDSKKDLKAFAPVAIFGDCVSNWKRAKEIGYSCVVVSVTPFKKDINDRDRY